MNLTDYLEKSNLTQAALGELLGVSQGAVGQWRLEGRRVPAEHCPAIERISNREVTCEELRPDVDWKYLRSAASKSSKKRRSPTDQPA